MSYTELEFDTATEAEHGPVDVHAGHRRRRCGHPAVALIDREYGARQDAFRRRVRDSGLTTQSFRQPGQAGALVERSLRELAETRRRIDSGMEREQVAGGAAAGAGLEVRQPAAGDGADLVPGPAGGDGAAGPATWPTRGSGW